MAHPLESSRIFERLVLSQRGNQSPSRRLRRSYSRRTPMHHGTRFLQTKPHASRSDLDDCRVKARPAIPRSPARQTRSDAGRGETGGTVLVRGTYLTTWSWAAHYLEALRPPYLFT